MVENVRSKLTYANVMATIAVFIALGGASYAAGVFTGKQKKQVEKISTQVFNRRIGGSSVAAANTANTAASANTANIANTAKIADSANTATSAETAGNAAKLGGLPAAQFQQALQSSCPRNGAYGAIESTGGATCVVPVTPIMMTRGESDTWMNLPGGLQLESVCHSEGETSVVFRNMNDFRGTLNWFYGDGTTAHASGVALDENGSEKEFPYAGKRLEGQFIWAAEEGSDHGQVVTVNLHVYDAGTSCEIRGTAVTAST